MKIAIDENEISNDIIRYCYYDDYAGGRADAVRLCLLDSDNTILKANIIRKGTELSCSDESVSSGKMYVSDIDFKNGICSIKALSTKPSALVERTYLRDKIAIDEIIREVALELDCEYRIYNPISFIYQHIDRINENALAYLSRILLFEGYLCKVYDGRLFVYSEKEFENSDSVFTITDEILLSPINLSTSDANLVAAVKNSYKTIRTEVYSGLCGKSLNYNIAVDSIEMSERISKNIIRKYNKNEYGGSCIIHGKNIFASQTIELDESYGQFDGKQFVYRVTHNMMNQNKNIYFRKMIGGDY